jgi:hypothetical protein
MNRHRDADARRGAGDMSANHGNHPQNTAAASAVKRPAPTPFQVIDLDTPEPYKSLIAAVKAADREACAASANGQFDRAYVPGEFWPVRCAQGTRVLVVRLGPHMRVRRPYCPTEEPPPPEAGDRP